MAQIPESDDATSDRSRLARDLVRVAEPVHGLTYYSPEINDLRHDGFRGWWHAYFGYRAAPMGRVGAGTVVAAFYNFAPRMVERAVPGVWEIMPPEQLTARRLALVRATVDRVFTGRLRPEVTEAAELARVAATGLPVGARPLFSAYAELPWPDDSPALELWHACTLLREHRGDAHAIALASAGVDPVESHLLMMAKGHGDRTVISRIRGWTDDEWQAGHDRLAARGLVGADGTYTEAGLAHRTEIERATDALSSAPVERLGVAGAERLIGLLTLIADFLSESGEVATTWPPPTVKLPGED